MQDSYATLLRSTELGQLFASHPQLKSQLKSIYAATHEPSQEDQESETTRRNRASRGRGRARGRGRGRGNTHDNHVPWTRERGLKDAMRQLKKARRVEGPQGEGLREFSALVTKIHEETAPSAQDRSIVAGLPPLDFLDDAA